MDLLRTGLPTDPRSLFDDVSEGKSIMAILHVTSQRHTVAHYNAVDVASSSYFVLVVGPYMIGFALDASGGIKVLATIQSWALVDWPFSAIAMCPHGQSREKGMSLVAADE